MEKQNNQDLVEKQALMKDSVQKNIKNLQTGTKENEGSGKRIFFTFLTVILGLSLLFYGLFLWSLLNGNLSNPLFDTIGLNPSDLKNFMKTTTNILFGGAALVFLILFLVKGFQWVITPKDDYNKPRLLKFFGIYFGFLVLISIIWGTLFLLISQANARNVQQQDSFIITTPENLTDLSAPQLIKFNIGERIFKEIATENVKQISWDLDGDGEFDDASGPIISYEFLQKGVYAVQAKVLYTVQNTNTEKEYIDTIEVSILNESVRADLVASTLTGQAPLSVNFSAEKSKDPDGEIVLYEWDLDDDNDFELKGTDKTTVDKVFNTIGEHIVRLRVIGRNNDFSVVEEKIVVTEPDEKIRAEIVSSDSKFSGIAPFEITLDGSQSFSKTGTIKYFQWDIEGETKSVLNRKISRKFSVPGQYKVTLTVENSNGEKDQSEQIITVSENINLSIKTAPSAKPDTELTGTVPFEVLFDGSDSSVSKAVEWRWDFEDDGIIDVYEKKARHIFRQAGTYNVKFTIIDAENISHELIKKVIVTDPPLVAKISSNVSSGEAPLEVNFDASASKANNERIINYIWKFPKTNPINSSAQISKEFDTPGVYLVELEVVTESGKRANSSLLISVLASPVKSVIRSNLSFGKAPLIVKFDGSDSVGDIVEWQWDFGDDVISKDINPSHRYSQPGVYTVKLRVKDSKGLLDTKVTQIVVE